ncbi:centrosomal protein of 128 kda [Plakobranchus ocellatus]|uniref:Centrosomal protein of 128 kDa n=1 Tax=Plakobranchus ocellatus TaxID=259542 RepID=A0AAV4CFC3_9GAST|nr:centrosomal protein of 128 kda [Plakobranchus ocellatus]
MSRYLSSESDDYYPPHPRTRQHAQTNDDRVYRLTQNLQDTTRNLKSLDHMLDDYSAVGSERRSAMDRIRGDLDRTYEDIRDERARANVLDRDYGSDSENYGSPSSSRVRRKRRSAVRFADDMNRELHGIHQTVRDLSSEQLKLEESFNKDSDRRDRHESDTRRSLQDIQSTLRGAVSMDPLSARVERRLQSIQNEIKSERLSLDNDRRSDDINHLSSELKSAISTAATASALDDKLRAHYLQSESVRHRVESELDNVRRRLDQTEGSKAALQAQVEQLRSQLARAEHDRNRIKSDLDESRIEAEVKEQRRRRAAEDAKSSHIERELHEMKGQLARSVGAVTELEDLRRRLDKSERQRMQLSDHIETLAKDLDNRERQSARVITQLKDVSDKYEDCERQRTFMAQQVEDLTAKLRDTGRELEKTTQELRNTQIALQESEKKKDEFKGRAQETVRQWKAKVKSLERDLDRQKHGTGQMLARHEQLVKEVEGHKQHGNYHQMAMESLKRELADALAVRAAQDEQLRLKDIEVNELKSLRLDLDREYRDSRTIADKLESELNLVRAKAATLSDERRKFEDKLSAVEAAHMLAQSQAHALQDDLKELSSVKANIAGQLAEAVAKNHDLQQSVVELEHREKAAKEETELYKQQLHSERNGLNSDYNSVKQQLNEAKVREAHMMQELSRKFRAHSAEQDATTQALRMELSEEKSNAKIANRNADRLKEELEILEKRFKVTEEENVSMRRKMDLVRNEFEAQKSLHVQWDQNKPCFKLWNINMRRKGVVEGRVAQDVYIVICK